MARGFLPPPAPGLSYPISAPPAGDFAHEGDALLTRIGANMGVAEARTEGRVPSPLSRAYMFYTALFAKSLVEPDGASADISDALIGEGRAPLQQRARATFRGVCAAFALREALGLEIALKRIPLVRDADPIARVLVPTLNAAPGGAAFWQAVRLFTVRSKADDKSPTEVLAGLSPLTAFFPAGKAPGRALASVFWYDATSGTWHDPTGADPTGAQMALTARTQAAVRGAMKAWLDQVVAAFPGSLYAIGVQKRHEDLIYKELVDWAADLAHVPPGEAIRVTNPTVETPPGESIPPFLLAACEGVPAGLLSDMPFSHGRLVVSGEALRDRGRRIWGGLFGHADLAARAAALPASGDNLGAALGLGADAAPVRFVAIDKLFAPRLTVLTLRGVSDRWQALPLTNGSTTEHALFPFRPEILELLSPSELAASVTGELAADALNYTIRLSFDGQTIARNYSTSGEGAFAVDAVVAPDTVDVRLFPEIDLSDLGEVLPATSQDAQYHARVRLGADWEFPVEALRLVSEDGARDLRRVEPFGVVERRGSNAPGPNGETPAGEAAFFVLPEKPAAFSFGDRGLALVRLRAPQRAGLFPQTWDVAIDFGTSNTCIAYRVGDAEETQILELPVFTTSLLKTPVYASLGATDEGVSAAADFFYKMSDADRTLVAGPYFPTQLLTQQKQIPEGRADGTLDLAAGLILFQTLSLGTGLRILEITEGFGSPGAAQGPALTRRFRLEQDIKWSRREWLRTFMAHLRTQVMLSAADQNARVQSVRFSYPKAFTRHEELAFESVLRSVWGDSLVRRPVSESEAVRHTLATRANQHVVFDIGGGTTDLIGFDGKTPVFQTSVELAGRQIGQYVLAVRAFRVAFADAVESVRPGVFRRTTEMLRGSGSSAQIANAWVGLLEVMEDEDPSGLLLETVLSTLRQSALNGSPSAGAIRGFFQTTALLFGGLAYMAGRLLRASSQGAFNGAFPLTEASLTLTGNGSKLFHTLSSDRAPLGDVFSGLFRAGLGDGDGPAYVHFKGIFALADGTLAPKTTVALGLLQTDGQTESVIPVANMLGECVADNPPTVSSVDFYSAIRRGQRYTPTAEAPPELSAFLDALGAGLPGGRRNGYDIIPAAGAAWTDDLKALFPRTVGTLLERLQATAYELEPDDTIDTVTTALEPLFVAELVALMDRIRTDNAS